MIRFERSAEKLCLKNLSDQFADEIHCDVTCDSCLSTPIKGLRFECDICLDYDQCLDCYKKNRISKAHSNNHPLLLVVQKNSRQIDPDKIIFGKVLDSGSFGTVYKARLLKSNQIVACKVVTIRKSDLVTPSLADLNPKQLIKSYVREINCYKEMQGVNILKFIGHCIKPIDEGLELMIITEYMSKGNLAMVIDADIELSYRRRLEIATGIISGVARLHELNFIHRDLRLENILIGEDDLPKIGDMGLAIHESCTQHMGPDIFSREVVTTKLDIFSFGLILVELFKGEYHTNELTKRINIIQKPVVFSYLVDQCLERDPAKRPNARCIENNLDLFRYLIDNFIFKMLNNYVFMDKLKKDETFVEIHDLIVTNLKGKLPFTAKDETKEFKSNIGCPIS